MNLKHLSILGSAVVFVGLHSAPAAISLTIDDFTQPYNSVSNQIRVNSLAPVASISQSGLTSPSVINGATRSATLVGAFPAVVSPAARVTTILTSGRLGISAGTGVEGGLVQTYGMPSPVDFTVGGGDRFALSVLSSDTPTNFSQLSLEVTSPVGTQAFVAKDVLVGDLEFAFSELPAFDFTQVTSLSLAWYAGDSYDGSLSFFGVSAPDAPVAGVPEPSLAAALGLVLLFGLGQRRRQLA